MEEVPRRAVPVVPRRRVYLRQLLVLLQSREQEVAGTLLPGRGKVPPLQGEVGWGGVPLPFPHPHPRPPLAGEGIYFCLNIFCSSSASLLPCESFSGSAPGFDCPGCLNIFSRSAASL